MTDDSGAPSALFQSSDLREHWCGHVGNLPTSPDWPTVPEPMPGDPLATTPSVEANLRSFIAKWRKTAGAERANKDLFVSELCAALDVPGPQPVTGDPEQDSFVFEQPVKVPREGRPTTKFIDAYKRGALVFEAKQGSEASSKRIGTAKRDTPGWHLAMSEAFGQAFEYASFLEEKPPFVIVADIGHCFDVYACFDGSGTYRPFPNALLHRVFLHELVRHAGRFRAIFLDPHTLDPSKAAVDVTREVAGHLADLSKRLEKAGHAPELVADFLMRCIFTMFAEDVGLLRDGIFTKALKEHWIENPPSFPGGIEGLWRAMDSGSAFGFFGKLLQFNGGLFKAPNALPLNKKDLAILLEAANCKWNNVEPAIFGTLFEQALDKKERHRLGAHFTPRAYVERLVRPTIEEPLREDWNNTQAKIKALITQNKVAKAKARVRAFLKQLSEVRVLDPACGTGNFLYVALDLMKGIEDEAYAALVRLEGNQLGTRIEAPEVTPKQFLGIEINPRAKSIAELVLWIGYLQWHFRARSGLGTPREPIMEDYGNIERGDAVLAYDREELALDDKGHPVTRWDGETMKRSQVTGEAVPDESAQVPTYRYVKPREADWPAAEFVVGNPPFLGNKKMRTVLGDGYITALRTAHGDVPESADFVMYWWNRAALLLQRRRIRRFGLITTNSIGQVFGRKVVGRFVHEGSVLGFLFVVPDHPWVDDREGAAVRIAMTVCGNSAPEGTLAEVITEQKSTGELELRTRKGWIGPSLRIGAESGEPLRLRANERLSYRGVIPHGDGFMVNQPSAIGRGSRVLLRPYRNGKDLVGSVRNLYVIDTFGLSEDGLRSAHPEAWQRLHDLVKPDRDQNPRKARRERWWLFGENQPKLRDSVAGLKRYIATGQTAKHRVFQFLESNVLPDDKIIAIASEDAFLLGVLSSRAHVVWALAVGARLEDRPVYNKTTCFDAFPFPDAPHQLRGRIRELGERIDAHRRSRQATHPELTITGMYNVLSKLRAGDPLGGKDRVLHGHGLVSVLRKLHEELDVAVAEAYGWPQDLSDEQILEKLVALNQERAEEESRGVVRWLRPEFQAPDEAAKAARPGIARAKEREQGPGVAVAKERRAERKKRASSPAGG